MMKKLRWLIPLVWLKLPCLAGRHYADDTIPRICAKFGQCFCIVHDEIACLTFYFLSTRIDCNALAINGNHIFRPRVPFARCPGLGLLRLFEPFHVSLLDRPTCDQQPRRTYVASCKKRLTLCIVIKAVGDDDIMMIGST
jgi:hypothetical protein